MESPTQISHFHTQAIRTAVMNFGTRQCLHLKGSEIFESEPTC
jgi:hypothetical protein